MRARAGQSSCGLKSMRASRSWPFVEWSLLILALSIEGRSAHAQESPYCLKVSARARGEAALLMSPSLHLQVLRNPSTFDVGPTLTERVQVRLGASWSPLDTWQGARLLDASAADCALHQVSERGERFASYSPDALLVSAYRAQAEALSRTHEERQQLAQRAANRLRDNVITVLEFHEFERLAGTVSKRHEELLGIVQRLHAEGIDEPPVGLVELAEHHASKSARLEQKEAAVRAFEPWKLRASGGVIPAQGRELDWFGWLELSYSLGGPAHAMNDRRYLRARAAERGTARYELAQRIAALRAQIDARIAQAQRELALVERQAVFIDSTLRALASSELAAVAHAREGLRLEQMLSESERAFLLTLIQTLSPLGSEAHVATK